MPRAKSESVCCSNVPVCCQVSTACAINRLHVHGFWAFRNEVDSMHSMIERKSENLRVFSPTEWEIVVALASSKKPYTVNVLETEDFIDWKNVAPQMVKNKKQNIEGEVVNWNKIHWLLFKRSDPNIIWYKYHYEGEFKQIRICSDKGRQKQPELKSAYSQAQLISEAKYKDLNRM